MWLRVASDGPEEEEGGGEGGQKLAEGVKMTVVVFLGEG